MVNEKRDTSEGFFLTDEESKKRAVDLLKKQVRFDHLTSEGQVSEKSGISKIPSHLELALEEDDPREVSKRAWDVQTLRRGKGVGPLYTEGPNPLLTDISRSSVKKIKNYRESMGELLQSPLGGNSVFSWTNPDGKSTPKASSIWASDSGFFFPSESAQKTHRSIASPGLLAMGDILVKGNPELAKNVKKCRICQRDSYFYVPKVMTDAEGFEMYEGSDRTVPLPTDDERMCQSCLNKKIVRRDSIVKLKLDWSYQEEKRLEDLSEEKQKKAARKLRWHGYKWDIMGLHSRIKPFDTTKLPKKFTSSIPGFVSTQELYENAFTGRLFRGHEAEVQAKNPDGSLRWEQSFDNKTNVWKDKYHRNEAGHQVKVPEYERGPTIQRPSSSERVSRFLQGIFDF